MVYVCVAVCRGLVVRGGTEASIWAWACTLHILTDWMGLYEIDHCTALDGFMYRGGTVAKLRWHLSPQGTKGICGTPPRYIY